MNCSHAARSELDTQTDQSPLLRSMDVVAGAGLVLCRVVCVVVVVAVVVLCVVVTGAAFDVVATNVADSEQKQNKWVSICSHFLRGKQGLDFGQHTPVSYSHTALTEAFRAFTAGFPFAFDIQIKYG